MLKLNSDWINRWAAVWNDRIGAVSLSSRSTFAGAKPLLSAGACFDSLT